ncbi:hypothetical protein [Haloferax sulfurifontis]|uniref:Uncharacterized protein n=1 Tax=Haloferax sulfurifontis TaxID=255616 RepID=A0A830DTK4_9EURY|nr:hypothetical protein [Haloferax sulfurifontis]GGC49933.1 hypothetical protein GCM10007209_09500 [Haloferax sulfurifontis]
MFPNTDRWDVAWQTLLTRGYLIPGEAPDDDTIDELVEQGWLRRDGHDYLWPAGAMRDYIEFAEGEKEE